MPAGGGHSGSVRLSQRNDQRSCPAQSGHDLPPHSPRTSRHPADRGPGATIHSRREARRSEVQGFLRRKGDEPHYRGFHPGRRAAQKRSSDR